MYAYLVVPADQKECLNISKMIASLENKLDSVIVAEIFKGEPSVLTDESPKVDTVYEYQVDGKQKVTNSYPRENYLVLYTDNKIQDLASLNSVMLLEAKPLALLSAKTSRFSGGADAVAYFSDCGDEQIKYDIKLQNEYHMKTSGYFLPQPKRKKLVVVLPAIKNDYEKIHAVDKGYGSNESLDQQDNEKVVDEEKPRGSFTLDMSAMLSENPAAVSRDDDTSQLNLSAAEELRAGFTTGLNPSFLWRDLECENREATLNSELPRVGKDGQNVYSAIAPYSKVDYLGKLCGSLKGRGVAEYADQMTILYALTQNVGGFATQVADLPNLFMQLDYGGLVKADGEGANFTIKDPQQEGLLEFEVIVSILEISMTTLEVVKELGTFSSTLTFNLGVSPIKPEITAAKCEFFDQEFISYIQCVFNTDTDSVELTPFTKEELVLEKPLDSAYGSTESLKEQNQKTESEGEEEYGITQPPAESPEVQKERREAQARGDWVVPGEETETEDEDELDTLGQQQSYTATVTRKKEPLDDRIHITAEQQRRRDEEDRLTGKVSSAYYTDGSYVTSQKTKPQENSPLEQQDAPPSESTFEERRENRQPSASKVRETARRGLEAFVNTVSANSEAAIAQSASDSGNEEQFSDDDFFVVDQDPAIKVSRGQMQVMLNAYQDVGGIDSINKTKKAFRKGKDVLISLDLPGVDGKVKTCDFVCDELVKEPLSFGFSTAERTKNKAKYNEDRAIAEDYRPSSEWDSFVDKCVSADVNLSAPLTILRRDMLRLAQQPAGEDGETIIDKLSGCKEYTSVKVIAALNENEAVQLKQVNCLSALEDNSIELMQDMEIQLADAKKSERRDKHSSQVLKRKPPSVEDDGLVEMAVERPARGKRFVDKAESRKA